MRDRVLLLVSLVLNAALAAVLVATFSSQQPKVRRVTRIVREPTAVTNLTRTNFVINQLHFNWRDVESDDFPTYIQNLRAIGCPEQTIRDIVVADVDQDFNRRRDQLAAKQDMQWWRAEKDPETNAAEERELAALETERRDLLSSLLGPQWDADRRAREQQHDAIALTGPVLGALSPETKSAVQAIARRWSDRQAEYNEAQEKAGKPVDEAEMWKLRRQTREELARVLTPEQLEEYLLRHSQTAMNIRADLGHFEPTPDEFRAIFRARDPVDMRLNADLTGDDKLTMQTRAMLEQQRDNALKQALGPQRYENYRLNQDSGYREVFGALQTAGAPPESARTVHQINLATQQELDRIRALPNVGEEQQKALVAAAEQERDRTLRGFLGEQTFTKFNEARAATWSQDVIVDRVWTGEARTRVLFDASGSFKLNLDDAVLRRRVFLDVNGVPPDPKKTP
jgi:hypothetical protein